MKETEAKKAAVFLAIVPKSPIGKRPTEHLRSFHSSKIPINGCEYPKEENNGLWYELIGDYHIPVLTLPSEEQCPIGKWGRMHRK